MKTRWIVLLAAASCLFATGAQATAIADYKRWKTEQRTLKLRLSDVMKFKLLGVYTGLDWANVVNKRMGQRPLFCPPPKMKATGDIVTGLVDRELADPVRGHRYKPTMPVELVVLMASRARWPCK